mmetsp:Transcript_40892/g.73578  ORF Transcript_40892/g.73578 Transcript_40892/m.73578 type:complete len:100 (+) Transcript_40892:215-514(+)
MALQLDSLSHELLKGYSQNLSCACVKQWTTAVATVDGCIYSQRKPWSERVRVVLNFDSADDTFSDAACIAANRIATDSDAVEDVRESISNFKRLTASQI